MHTLHVLNSRGDTAVEWDLDAPGAIREAERIFRDNLRTGASAFRVEANKPAVRMDKFDKRAEKIVIVPRVAGG